MRGLPSDLFLPPIAQAKGKAHNRALKLVENWKKDEPIAFKGHEHWNEDEIAGVLLSRQWLCCAYCGRKLSTDNYDVDHFRPKGKIADDPMHGGYWWLAYHLPNLYLSCPRPCNSRLKWNRFPVKDKSCRTTYNTRGGIANECRLLLDPVFDPVEDWVRFDWKSDEPSLIPAQGIPDFAVDRVNETIRLLELNTNIELQRGWYSVKRRLVDYLTENSNERAKRMAIRFRPHSIVARDMLRHLRPELLPTAAEEANYLIRRMLAQLKTVKVLMKRQRTNILAQQADRLLWAIASLSAAQWHGSTEEIAGRIQMRGIFDQIEDYKSRLVKL